MRRALPLLAALALLGGALAAERGAVPVAAMKAPLAARAPLVAAAQAGASTVAVGDYGVVLRSTDGVHWDQADAVPYAGLLTAVSFVSDKDGWAVGHGGTVLRSADGGRNWQALPRPEGDPVLLSVWFKDALHGIVTGAYGAAFATADGGRSWKRLTVRPGRDGEIHLNHVFAARDGTLYIAAETGAAFRSADGGASWQDLKTGASGSLWGGTALRDGTVVLIGMTGRLLASRDRGDTWKEIRSGTDQALTSVAETAEGGILAVGTGGAVVRAGAGLAEAKAEVRPDRQNLAALALRADGRPVYFGQLGVSAGE